MDLTEGGGVGRPNQKPPAIPANTVRKRTSRLDMIDLSAATEVTGETGGCSVVVLEAKVRYARGS